MKNLSLFVSVATICTLCISCNILDPAPAPVSKFEFDVGIDFQDMVWFYNRSENATEFHWDFGDGETSQEEHPEHAYKKNGTYTVTLTASNKDKKNTYTQEITIFSPTLFLVPKNWKLVSASGVQYISRAPGFPYETIKAVNSAEYSKYGIIEFRNSRELFFPEGFGKYQFRILTQPSGQLYLEYVILNVPTSIGYALIDIDTRNESFTLIFNQETQNKTFSEAGLPLWHARGDSEMRFVYKRK